MKSRDYCETPGGTIMLRAHRAIESITLDRETVHLEDELIPRDAHIICNGYWWSPELRLARMGDGVGMSVGGTRKRISAISAR